MTFYFSQRYSKNKPKNSPYEIRITNATRLIGGIQTRFYTIFIS